MYSSTQQIPVYKIIVLFIVTLTVSSVYSQKKRTTHDVLMDLYKNTNGENWKRSTNWGSDLPFGDWYGIKTKDGEVIALDLSSNSLEGKIPNSIGELKKLEALLLSYNKITELPDELGQLKQLRELNLYTNLLTTLPQSILQLTELHYLYLDKNKLGFSVLEMTRFCNVKYYYSDTPQRKKLKLSTFKKEKFVVIKSNYKGQHTKFEWYCNGKRIGNTNDSLQIYYKDVQSANYTCRVTNKVVKGQDYMSNSIQVTHSGFVHIGH